ncbi:MAG: DUF4863 family protein [Planctomycetota bacterium]
MIETFQPLLDAAQGVDLGDPEAARAELTNRLDPDSEEGRAISRALVALLEEGSIADRGAPPLRYGRAAKASDESLGFSIDVVDMSGPGPLHRHPNGEVNWCIALDGDPRFVGKPAGWVVEPPGSEHVPEVTEGRMLIVYLLPDGAIEFVQ